MKLLQDDATAQWLTQLGPAFDDFDWDDGNRGKSEKKHGVTDEEIESLMSTEAFVFAGRIESPRVEWRGLLLGRTPESRLLALVFTRRGGKMRPI